MSEVFRQGALLWACLASQAYSLRWDIFNASFFPCSLELRNRHSACRCCIPVWPCGACCVPRQAPLEAHDSHEAVGGVPFGIQACMPEHLVGTLQPVACDVACLHTHPSLSKFVREACCRRRDGSMFFLLSPPPAVHKQYLPMWVEAFHRSGRSEFAGLRVVPMHALSRIAFWKRPLVGRAYR